MADIMSGNTTAEKSTGMTSGEEGATTAPLDRSSEEWRRQFGALPSAHQRPRPQATQPQQPTMPQNPTSPTIPAGAMPTGVLAAAVASPQPMGTVSTGAPRNRRVSSFAAAGGAILILTGMLAYGFWPSRGHAVAGVVNGATAANAATEVPTATEQQTTDMTGVAPLSGLSVPTPAPPPMPLNGIAPPPATPRPEPVVNYRSKPGAPSERVSHPTELATAHTTPAVHEAVTPVASHPAAVAAVPKAETPHSQPAAHEAVAAPAHPAAVSHTKVHNDYDETNPLGLPQ